MTQIPKCGFFLCMAGTIRTQQKCPKCGGKFPKELICLSCQTRATRYYIDLWWHGERFSIFKTSLGFPLDSLAQAEQILSTIRHQISTGQFDAREWVPREIRQLEFAGYAQIWLERMATEHISRGWLKQIERITRIFLIPHFGRLSIREIREGHIIDLNRSLPKHYRNKTRKNILNVLRRLLSEALVRRDIVVMPQFPRIEKQESETKWLTQGEQERVLANLQEPYRTYFLFCMKHGCRLAEARALWWEQIDLKRSVVTIKASMDLNVRKPFTKEGDIRVLPLNTSVRQRLLTLPRSLTGYVFVNRMGRPLSGASIRRAWGIAARAAGIQISAYQGSRHSFATQKLMQGYSETFVMKATGHKTVNEFRRYGKVVTEALRNMIEGESKEKIKKQS